MFFKRYARTIVSMRWLILAVWVLSATASQLLLPSLNKVVASKGTTYLPSSAPSMVASQWLKTVDPSGQTPSTTIVAIENPHQLTSSDVAYFNRVLQNLNRHKATYHIRAVTAQYNTNAKLASSFGSKDKTTEIALIGLTEGAGQPDNTKTFQQLHQAFSNPPSRTRIVFTGDAEIQQDNMNISQSGVSKSGTVTIVLVLGILLLVFKSIVAPLVTLLSIGMSFLMTSGLVAWLANLGLPVSTFTQTFLIAILFGAGTDYSIIIMNRFREELMHGHPTREDALFNTLRAVSKTVLFSGLTVFVSFAILYFAKFGLYQSAVGVAVGMLVSLLTCLVFVPAVLAILGGGLFWPRRLKVGASHPPFKFWAWSGRLSTQRPWVMLAILVIVLAPVGMLFTNRRTFDPMTDIPQAPSVQGFHLLSNKFGQGKVMPVSLVLHTSANLRSPQGLATIQNISETLQKASGAAEVDSATQPTGSPISGFQLTNQDLQLAKSLGKVNAGVTAVQKGLNQANPQSNGSLSGLTKLKSGAAAVSSGMGQLTTGLSKATQSASQITSGSQKVAQGSKAFSSGLSSLASGATQTAQAASQVAGGLGQAKQGATALASGTAQLSQSQAQLQKVAAQLANALALWSQSHPNDASQPSWQQIEALANGLANGEQGVTAGAKTVQAGASQLNASLGQLTTGSTKLSGAVGQVANGANQLAKQSQSLTDGSQSVASGLAQFSNGMQTLTSSAGQLQQGSQGVTTGIAKAQVGMGQLGTGLQKTNRALNSIHQGIGGVQSYLQQSGKSGANQNPGFYVPASTLTSNSQLQQALKAYVSPDGHTAKFSVVLNSNPYSAQSIADIPNLVRVATTALKASPIATGEVLASGATATQADLNSVSTADFIRTMAIVLAAILLLLIVMLRSVFTPLYIILSLGGTYFVTMGIIQEVVIKGLHEPGISWVTPFFVFLLLVALGVDYSIFLMSRFEEELPNATNVQSAMRDSMSRMGGVIYSAALIMAGTFGSLGASGVTSLLEIAMGVVIGLFIYTTVFMGFFVPAASAVVGEGHYWPFGKGHSHDNPT